MKTKAIRNLISDLFPADCGPVFEQCHTAREIRLVASAFQIAAGTIAKFTREKAVAEAQFQAALDSLEARVTILKEEVAARQFTQVRPPEEVVENVYLIRVDPTNFNGTTLRNKLGLIKAVRDLDPDMGLLSAKTLVEDVMDNNTSCVVFKGSQAKAAVAARILAGYGGVTERKEAF